MKFPLFIYLTAFSTNGGIEKFNRAFLKALVEIFPNSKAISIYDKRHHLDERYFPKSNFKSAGSNKWMSLLKTLFAALFSPSEMYIYGHINLAAPAILINKLRPNKKMVFIAHGIEVWNNLSKIQILAFQKADRILAVSSYTKRRLVEEKDIEENKIKVFHNTLDPFFEKPKDFGKAEYLMQRYGLKEDHEIIFTLCRLSSKEAYKGYDRVVEALPQVLESHPNAVYLIAGKYDGEERSRVEGIAKKNNVLDKVFFTGFLKDEEIIDHYLLADLFVMPSKNEGFGIVYLEAMACGLPVIAGNQDGSVDALKNGELGSLVNPDDIGEIAGAINRELQKSNVENSQKKLELQSKVMEGFGFEVYKKRLKEVLSEL